MHEEQETKSISFSEYSSYLACPHKWYLSYILRLPGDVSEELIFGSAVHNTIETILMNKTMKRLFMVNKEKVVMDVFKGCMKDELSKIQDVQFLRNFEVRKLSNIFVFQAKDLILKLDFFNKFKDYEIYDVELKLDGYTIFEDPSVKITFKGYVDLILKHKITGKYLILDWKTSMKAWDIIKKVKDNPDFYAQLCLYKIFLAKIKELDFASIQTKFYNLPRAEPLKQSSYEGILNENYAESFLKRFVETAHKIYLHSKKLEDFKKAKHISPKNWCFRCKFNTPEYCNDHDEYQKVLISTP